MVQDLSCHQNDFLISTMPAFACSNAGRGRLFQNVELIRKSVHAGGVHGGGEAAGAGGDDVQQRRELPRPVGLHHGPRIAAHRLRVQYSQLARRWPHLPHQPCLQHRLPRLRRASGTLALVLWTKLAHPEFVGPSAVDKASLPANCCCCRSTDSLRAALKQTCCKFPAFGFVLALLGL